jgi:hypothetical protein
MTGSEVQNRVQEEDWEQQDRLEYPVDDRVPEQEMQKAIDLFQQGEKVRAQKVLARLVMSEPEYAEAWFGLARCLDDPEHRNYCLRKVLVLDPGHRMAKRLLTPKTRHKPEPILKAGYDYPGAFLFQDEQRKKRFLISVALAFTFFVAAALIVDGLLS